MVVTCNIDFDNNPQATFFVGHLVSGTVTLKTDKTEEVQAVVLKVTGFAATNWTQKYYGILKEMSALEEYMTTLTYLLGSEQPPIAKCTIAAGTHQYTFAFQLPYNCPTSFEGSCGHIRYVVKVQIQRPWKYDQTYSRGITVLRTADLNFESPQLKVPSHTSNYRIFGCGPCTTEPLRLELRIPKSGFVPGEKITASLLVINNTNIGIAAMEILLVMSVRYHCTKPVTRVERTAIAIGKADSVLKKCTRSFEVILPVPSTPPSTSLNVCKIIQIAYQVEVIAKMKRLYGDQMISTPVTIGNVPLWKTVVTQQPSKMHNPGEANEAASSAEDCAEQGSREQRFSIPNTLVRSAQESFYPDLPHPSYEESLHATKSNLSTRESYIGSPIEFSPLYPVYSILNEDEESANDHP